MISLTSLAARWLPHVQWTSPLQALRRSNLRLQSRRPRLHHLLLRHYPLTPNSTPHPTADKVLPSAHPIIPVPTSPHSSSRTSTVSCDCVLPHFAEFRPTWKQGSVPLRPSCTRRPPPLQPLSTATPPQMPPLSSLIKSSASTQRTAGRRPSSASGPHGGDPARRQACCVKCATWRTRWRTSLRGAARTCVVYGKTVSSERCCRGGSLALRTQRACA